MPRPARRPLSNCFTITTGSIAAFKPKMQMDLSSNPKKRSVSLCRNPLQIRGTGAGIRRFAPGESLPFVTITHHKYSDLGSYRAAMVAPRRFRVLLVTEVHGIKALTEDQMTRYRVSFAAAVIMAALFWLTLGAPIASADIIYSLTAGNADISG